MAQERRVLTTEKDTDGDILALGGTFGRVSKMDAINQIESGTYTYFVARMNGDRKDVRVVEDSSVRDGKYLRSDHDVTTSDNLDNLPDL
jgi:hypothetical protein